MIRRFVLLWLAVGAGIGRADEGMWLPSQVHTVLRQRLADAGCRLTPEAIYSTDRPSLKDAVVLFGGFCTGGFISPDGLLITNHHCALDALQELSTPERNYLRDGFNAHSYREEMPVPDLWIRILVRIDDVTPAFAAIQQYPEGFGKRLAFGLIADSVVRAAVHQWEKATGRKGFKGQVRPFFEEARYVLMLYQEYSDIRLVLAPPMSIGKFGGNQDNWQWPRHTADFAIFRVYADSLGNPADYSPLNRPYRPSHFLPISLRGVGPDSFTMILGFPGKTHRYLPPHDIIIRQHITNPALQTILGIITHEMERVMATDSEATLALADRYAGLSNLYKYTLGQQEGLFRYKVADRKVAEELIPFLQWLERHHPADTALLDSLARSAHYLACAGYEYFYLQWFFSRPNIRPLVQEIIRPYVEGRLGGRSGWRTVFEELEEAVHRPYAWMDHRIAAELLRTLYNAPDCIPSVHTALRRMPGYDSMVAASAPHPHFRQSLRQIFHQYFGVRLAARQAHIFQWTVDSFFRHSNLFNRRARRSLARAWDYNPQKALRNDEFLSFLADLYAFYTRHVRPLYVRGERLRQASIRRYQQLYFRSRGLDSIYPDANGTLRFTYGHVASYEPADAVTYHPLTTHRGILEKYRPHHPDYDAPPSFIRLLQAEDFGRFADARGRLPTCFITTNDISGGNSGSPTINADGALVGIAFDSNWEGIVGDLFYIPETNRTIVVDIRFVIWYIQRYADNLHVLRSIQLIQ